MPDEPPPEEPKPSEVPAHQQGGLAHRQSSRHRSEATARQAGLSGFWADLKGREVVRVGMVLAAISLSSAVPVFASSITLLPAENPTHQFEEVASGVYFVTGTARAQALSNSMIIVGEQDCILVDTHVSALAANALIKALASITDKPIRTVILTHYHFDHAHGNQAFGPEVRIIGHEFTRKKLSGNIHNDRTFKGFTESIPHRIEQLKYRAANENDPEKKGDALLALKAMEDYNAWQSDFSPVPPNVTLVERLTLFSGSREVQIIFPGRAHTGGDLVVYLPYDRLIFTGDLLLANRAYMGDAYVDEWPATLEKLKSLDFDLILPGHGAPITSRKNLDTFQSYLRDLWSAASRLEAEGIPYEEAAKQIDMRAYQEPYGILRIGVEPRYAQRIYERIAERKRAE